MKIPLLDNKEIILAVSNLRTASDVIPITPSDNDDLSQTVRALLIGTAGNIKVTTASGNTRTIYAPVGVLPLQVAKVFSTGTDAEDISGLV